MATSFEVVCYCMGYVTVSMLFVVSVQTSFVQLGPTEHFKLFSEVIFPGEVLRLECVASDITNCEISLYLNDTVIYQSGRQLYSGNYVITKNDSLCLLNVLINYVTVQNKGIYKCQIHNEDTTMVDTFKLNVVTKWPHCLAKCVESGNSFQLYCYTSSPRDGPPVFMTWKITEPGRDPMVFLNFNLSRLNKGSFVKTVGVSHQNIQKENITIGYRCSHFNHPSLSCFINLTPIVINNVTSPTITTDLPTSQSDLMSTLRQTSSLYTQSHHTTEKLRMNPARDIIIIVVIATVVFVISSVTVAIIICKMKRKMFVAGPVRKRKEPHIENDLVYTGCVLRQPSHQDGLQSSNGDISINDTEGENSSHFINRTGRQPTNELYNTIEESNDRRSGSEDKLGTKVGDSTEAKLNSHKIISELSPTELPEDMYEHAQRHRYTGNQSPLNDVEEDSSQDQLKLQAVSRDDEEQENSNKTTETKTSRLSSQGYQQFPKNLYSKVKKRSDVNYSYRYRPQDEEKDSYETNYNTSEVRRDSAPVEELYKKIDKTAIRNGTKVSVIEPYQTTSIDNIGDLIAEEAYSDNNIEMVECVAYEPYQEETVEEDEDHYDVLDPSKEDNRDE